MIGYKEVNEGSPIGAINKEAISLHSDESDTETKAIKPGFGVTINQTKYGNYTKKLDKNKVRYK